MAKHAKDNIGCLDEELYQNTLWEHTPLTDFWRVGAGMQKRLSHVGIMTMSDIAHADEDMLYNMFGVDAELLIDHAWGRETVTMEDIKSYQPQSNSLSCGQVLLRDYTFEEGRLIVKEMVDSLCLDMASQGIASQSFTLTVGYSYEAELKPAVGTVTIPAASNSYRVIVPNILKLYERIVHRGSPIRKLNVSCNNVTKEIYQQYHLFNDYAAAERDEKLQRAVLEIKRRYGKNAIVRGMDLQEAGTAMERNRQIGGHKSGE